MNFANASLGTTEHILDDGITDLGELQKDYLFSCVFRKPENTDDVFIGLLSDVNLDYLGSRVKSIDLPTTDIQYKDVDYGSVKVPYPTQVSYNTFKIVFLEDIDNFVSQFFRAYFYLFKGGKENNYANLNFRPFKKGAMSLSISRTRKTISKGSLSSLKPRVNYEAHYTFVIPTGVVYSKMDKSGEGYMEVTVTFVRWVDFNNETVAKKEEVVTSHKGKGRVNVATKVQ